MDGKPLEGATNRSGAFAGVDPPDHRGGVRRIGWRSKRARAVFALVARRVRSAAWPAIGRHLGMSETGVRRLALGAAKVERQDRRLREEIERMMTKISECGMLV